MKTKKARVGDVILLGGHEYVVEDARMTGGGTGHGAHDVYPDGWQVRARRLDNGNYDPKGRLRTFYMSGCFNGMIREVEVVRKLTKTFI